MPALARGLDSLATPDKPGRPVHPQYIAKLVSDLAADDAIITADVGTPTVWAARYLKMTGKRRLLFSGNHGSMANALPQAMGAQAAFPDRQVISLSGDGGFAMSMGDFLSLAQLGLPVKVIVFDNSLLGFVAMEQKAGGFLDVNVQLHNPDFAAIAEACGVLGLRVEDSDALEPPLRGAGIPRRALGMGDAAPGGHEVHGAGGDFQRIALAVAVHHPAVEQIGDGGEANMGMGAAHRAPGRPRTAPGPSGRRR